MNNGIFVVRAVARILIYNGISHMNN